MLEVIDTLIGYDFAAKRFFKNDISKLNENGNFSPLHKRIRKFKKEKKSRKLSETRSNNSSR